MKNKDGIKRVILLRIDEDGYIWIIGRIDDVIKVSGYRLGTAEIESALVSHPTSCRSSSYCITS